MSSTPLAPGRSRVRDQAREVAVVMAFSAVTSVSLAFVLVLLAGLGQGS